MAEKITILELLKEDRITITYRPKFADLLGNVTSGILLQQMIYWWGKKGTAFYKFKEPCAHKKYTAGQSWCEELAFTRREFDSALKTMATKSTKGSEKSELMAFDDDPIRRDGEDIKAYAERFDNILKHIVIYWTDKFRVTWYWVNEALLEKVVNALYLEKGANRRYLEKARKGLFQEESETADTSDSGITSGITSDIDSLNQSSITDSGIEESAEDDDQTPIDSDDSIEKSGDIFSLYKENFGAYRSKKEEVAALEKITERPWHQIEEAAKRTKARLDDGHTVNAPGCYMAGIFVKWDQNGYDGPGATVAAAISADDEQGDRPPSKPTRGAVSSITQNVLNSVAADHSQEADDWRAALVQLSVQVDAETFHTKFREAVLIGIGNDVFIIGVPDEHTRSYLSGRLIRSIGRILRDVCGRDIELRFEVWTPGLDAIKQAEAVIESVEAQDDVPVAPVGEAIPS